MTRQPWLALIFTLAVPLLGSVAMAYGVQDMGGTSAAPASSSTDSGEVAMGGTCQERAMAIKARILSNPMWDIGAGRLDEWKALCLSRTSMNTSTAGQMDPSTVQQIKEKLMSISKNLPSDQGSQRLEINSTILKINQAYPDQTASSEPSSAPSAVVN
jgi:hypothetical protein